VIFLEFTDNEKKIEEGDGMDDYVCTISNYYLCEFFIEIIDNEKLEESDGIDGVDILHVKRYVIRTYS
jgi:hypothetical protein